MAVQARIYRPRANSERRLDPLNTCTIVSTWYGWMFETLGEYAITPAGDPWTLDQCTNDIRAARAATGEPDRPGYGSQHLDTFFKTWGSPLRKSDVSFIRDRATIMGALNAGQAIVMAGNTRGCRPDSPLRKWVGEADHRMIFFDVEHEDGSLRFIDPMVPAGQRHVRTAPIQDMFDFGARFRHAGLFYAERYLRGRWTKASIATREGAALTLQAQKKYLALLKDHREVSGELDQVIDKYNTLDAKYQALLAEGQPIDRDKLEELLDQITIAAGSIMDQADQMVDLLEPPTTGP